MTGLFDLLGLNHLSPKEKKQEIARFKKALERWRPKTDKQVIERQALLIKHLVAELNRRNNYDTY